MADCEGWTNWETHNTKLHFDSDPGLRGHWIVCAQSVCKDENAVAMLSKHMLACMEHFLEQLGEVAPTNVMQAAALDLLNCASSRINWAEIAAHYIDEVSQ